MAWCGGSHRRELREEVLARGGERAQLVQERNATLRLGMRCHTCGQRIVQRPGATRREMLATVQVRRPNFTCASPCANHALAGIRGTFCLDWTFVCVVGDDGGCPGVVTGAHRALYDIARLGALRAAGRPYVGRPSREGAAQAAAAAYAHAAAPRRRWRRRR